MSTVIKTSGRNTYIDCVKRMSIALVIWGVQFRVCTRNGSFVLEKGFYMFHMPLFISVSGYLFYPSITKEAGAVLNKTYTEEWKLYGGVPAKPIKDISKDAKYFNRKIGFVY